jgi:hypothetical protein
MLFSSWLRYAKGSLERRLAVSHNRRRKSSARRFAARPRLEALEDRVVPASLGYSTLLNGTVYASAVDSSGDIYVTGTAGSNLPTTPGAFQTNFGGGGTYGEDAFVAKLNPTGTAVLYATYLGIGGRSAPGGTSIAVDAAGDAYVIGDIAGVPTTANAIASSGGAFVAELNPTGSTLLYGTYLPGTLDTDYPLGYTGAIAVDGSGDIYVAGAARAGLPVTAGAFQTAYLGSSNPGSNAFFMKINPALSGTASVLYASYLGGSGYVDAATAIALDASGNAYLYGITGSSNFPTTSGAFQRTFGGGGFYGNTAFVAKFNPALSGAASLVFSTYLGGSGSDGFVSSQPLPVPVEGLPQIDGGIAVDSTGNIYVTGGTTSTNFPTTSGAYQPSSNMVITKKEEAPPSDIFVTKLNPTGSALVYSTYLGGGGNKSSGGTYSGGSGIAVDASGNAYVTGWTNSTTFPTKSPIQATNHGGMDSFVTVLNPSGSGLLFSTYLGGSSNDLGWGIALDTANNVYVAGQTGSNFPTTAGAYDTTSGSGFVAKISAINPAVALSVRNSPSSTTAGVAGPITVTAKNASGSTNTNNSTALSSLSSAGSGSPPATDAAPSELSSAAAILQQADALVLQRLDALLSVEAGAMGVTKDTLIRDHLFASVSVS